MCTRQNRYVMNHEIIPPVATVPHLTDIESLLVSFLASVDVTPGTRAVYEKGVRRFFQWLSGNGKGNPNRDTIVAYKRHLTDTGMSANTVSTYLVAVRKFFEWTEAVRLYPNVGRSVKGAKASRRHRRDSLTVSQVRELLDSIDSSTLLGKRDYALINLLVCTGLRTIEVIRADVGDIRQEGNCPVLWVYGKGRSTKDDFVLLTEHVYRPILTYLSARGPVSDDLPLFTSGSNRNHGLRLTTRAIRGIVKKYLRQIGLDSVRLTAHSLRHTAVTLSLQAGASIQEAQAMARHANINTTLVYAHNLDRLQHGAERKIESLLHGGKECR